MKETNKKDNRNFAYKIFINCQSTKSNDGLLLLHFILSNLYQI